MSGKVISVVSTKGSVGKTTLIIHIAGYLASRGKRVLLIDADSQQSLSKFFDYQGVDMDIPYAGFGKWLVNDASAEEVIRKTAHADPKLKIDIIVNDDPGKLRVSRFLRDNSGAIYKLAALVKPLREQYDYIFLDTEGTDGRDHDGNSVQNAVLLAEPDLVLTVTRTGLMFAMEALRVVDVYKSAVKTYTYIGKNHAPPLKFIINAYDRTIGSSETLLKELCEAFEMDDFRVAALLKTVVPLRRGFFERYYSSKEFMHELKDRNTEPLNDVVRRLCEEIFPELVETTAAPAPVMAQEA